MVGSEAGTGHGTIVTITGKSKRDMQMRELRRSLSVQVTAVTRGMVTWHIHASPVMSAAVEQVRARPKEFTVSFILSF